MKEGAVGSLTGWYFYDGRYLNSRNNELAITIKNFKQNGTEIINRKVEAKRNGIKQKKSLSTKVTHITKKKFKYNGSDINKRTD